MPDLADGDSVEVKGSGAKPYVLKNVGGVYCVAARRGANAGGPIDRRTCKHLGGLRGEAVELARTRAPAGARSRLVPKPARLAPRPARRTATRRASSAACCCWRTCTSPTSTPTGWWMSEKLDGVRAYWDGKRFVSRLGNVYHAPEGFTGRAARLHAGRRAAARSQGVPAHRERGAAAGRAATRGGRSGFWCSTRRGTRATSRRGCATTTGSSSGADRRSPARSRIEICTGAEHLQRELRRVEALGGEGLMLRRPGSRYEAGRSHLAAQGQDVPRRRGAGGRAPAAAPASTRGGSGRCWSSSATARGSPSAPGCPTPTATTRPWSARSSRLRYARAVGRRGAALPSFVGVRPTTWRGRRARPRPRRRADDAVQGGSPGRERARGDAAVVGSRAQIWYLRSANLH